MRRTTLLIAVMVLLAGEARAQDQSGHPWTSPGGLPGEWRYPGLLCADGKVTTESPLDLARLPRSAMAALTPPLAQSAGLLAMISQVQRGWMHEIIVQQLTSAGLWTRDAQDGLFDYLVRQADDARSKVETTRSVLGGVTGGLAGLLLGRHVDDANARDVDGVPKQVWSGTANGALNGRKTGAGYATALMPTTFVIREDRANAASVVSVLVSKPCDRSAGDAIKALRQPE